MLLLCLVMVVLPILFGFCVFLNSSKALTYECLDLILGSSVAVQVTLTHIQNLPGLHPMGHVGKRETPNPPTAWAAPEQDTEGKHH